MISLYEEFEKLESKNFEDISEDSCKILAEYYPHYVAKFIKNLILQNQSCMICGSILPEDLVEDQVCETCFRHYLI